MSRAPIDLVLDGVVWVPVETAADHDDLPYVTHQGVLRIADTDLRCYQLNDGRRIFNAEDLSVFFGIGPDWVDK